MDIDGRVRDGMLRCVLGHTFPIVKNVPRFVPADNYAGNFGYQWLKFRKTQLDSYSGQTISAERFFNQSGWSAADLQGKRVLDVGCGAGRFTEVVLDAGAQVISVDYSEAVDACFSNHGSSASINVIQADIFHLPFKDNLFDYIYCFGVLQHTPDPRTAFLQLPRLLKMGGSLAVDVYRKHWSNVFHSKYWLRPLSKRIQGERLFGLIENAAPRLLPISDKVAKLPGGRYLRRVIPVANYRGIFPLTESQLREWAILDTFDWLGPRDDLPQTATTLRSWFIEAGLTDIEVVHPAHLTARGKKGIEGLGEP